MVFTGFCEILFVTVEEVAIVLVLVVVVVVVAVVVVVVVLCVYNGLH